MPVALNKACDILDWEDPDFLALANQIIKPAIRHRKLWEFTQTIRALREFGLWSPDALGLAVAGGTERLLYYAANHIKRIVSTDIYGHGEFKDREAQQAVFDNPSSFAPFPYRKDHLKLVRADALKLPFSEGLFDFAWNLSSIEHFGGYKKALISVHEMARVIRPGGVIVITTECALNGRAADQVFQPRQLRRLCQESGLDLVQDLDLNVSTESKRYLLNMRKDKLDQLPHINLQSRASIFTSVSLVLVKPGPKKPQKASNQLLGDQRFKEIDRICRELNASNQEQILEQQSDLKKLFRYGVKKGRSVLLELSNRLLPVDGL